MPNFTREQLSAYLDDYALSRRHETAKVEQAPRESESLRQRLRAHRAGA